MNSSLPLPATKVAVFGLGFIGRLVVEALQQERPFSNQRLELFGIIDIVPESRAWAEKKKIRSFHSLEEMLKEGKPDVCIHSTSSTLKKVLPELKELIKAGIPVLSSCEELFYPWVQNTEIAKSLDKLCIENKVALLGTGVNPGFVMDVLPAISTQAVLTVEKIHVQRIVDAASRRPPLQKKVGIGLDEPTFHSMVKSGKIGHIGFAESIDFIADYMGWTIAKRGQTIEPLLAVKNLKTKISTIKKGEVCGLKQKAWAENEDQRKIIELDLTFAIKAHRPGDHIVIQGEPPLSLWIENGVAGEPATISALIRGIPLVIQARPGIVRRLERSKF